MYQSSTRTNFLDSLLDPTAIAILASIALHATLGAGLPFFTQPDKTGTKVGPGTVKVVELTPGELQRIPQAPPTPAPQVLPPVTQTIVARPSVAPPRTPQFSTSPQTIPFSPIRVPLEKVAPKPSAGNKTQKAPQQPTAPIFDPNFSVKPSPKPSKPAIPKGKSQSITRKSTAPTPQETPGTDNDGSDEQKPTTKAQNPSDLPNSSPKPTPSTQPPANSAGGNKNGIQAAATAKEIEYRTKYPRIVVYDPITLRPPYPPNTPCPKVKQSPPYTTQFIVYMVVFDKVPENQNNNILGETTADSLDSTTFADEDTPENRKLSVRAKEAAIYEANKTDQNRPAADKGKQVLYRYRVEFDPSTCKK
jgi:hypothetical protein